MQKQSNLYKVSTYLKYLQSLEKHVKLHLNDGISKNQIMSNFIEQDNCSINKLQGGKEMERKSMY